MRSSRNALRLHLAAVGRFAVSSDPTAAVPGRGEHGRFGAVAYLACEPLRRAADPAAGVATQRERQANAAAGVPAAGGRHRGEILHDSLHVSLIRWGKNGADSSVAARL